VSVTPIQFDLTAYNHLDAIRGWRWNGRQE